MQLSFTEKKNIRKNFGKLRDVLSIPNLIEVQKKSYNQFLSTKINPEQKVLKGLGRVFKSIYRKSNYRKYNSLCDVLWWSSIWPLGRTIG